ncbi:MAG TPA: 3-hexulose-6-phosphate synthase [Campylobacteraceae bacterium]|nr:3-hexulose-6-phosphate synthase [Campylobacteraceae bacterium]
MKLQLALDVLTTDEAMKLAEATKDSIDIIEIGTPLIKHEGIGLVKKMRKAFPDKEILVDLKTMDVGEYEADFCFDAGADIVTVLGVADSGTIEGAIKSAKKHGKKVMVDLINVKNKVKRAKKAKKLGADYVGIHSGIDQQNRGHSPLEDLKEVSKKVNIPIVVAGGINQETIADIIKHKPAVVVVGGAITGSKNPAKAARKLKESMTKRKKKVS